MSRFLLLILFTAVIIVALPLPPVVAQSPDRADRVQLQNPLGEQKDIRAILGGAVQKGLGVLGSIVLLVFFIGGFMWLTSGGNEERVSKGTQTMLWAAIGVFIIFAAYAILSLVIGGLTR